MINTCFWIYVVLSYPVGFAIGSVLALKSEADHTDDISQVGILIVITLLSPVTVPFTLAVLLIVGVFEICELYLKILSSKIENWPQKYKQFVKDWITNNNE